MIVVKGATRAHDSKEWKGLAEGEMDSFGNPFHIIRLKWHSTSLHRMATYAKTRGFDDAVITVNRSTGNLKITYREKKGSIMWERPLNGVGPFIGEVAKTPRNMRILATHYRDGLWSIYNDPSTENEVRIMSDRIWAEMDEKERKYNEERIRSMHTHSLEKRMPGWERNLSEGISKDEERRLLAKERMELAKKQAEIEAKEQKLLSRETRLAEVGVGSTSYSEQYLAQQPINQIRRICREMRIVAKTGTTKEGMIKKIIARQNKGDAALQEAKQQMAAEEGLQVQSEIQSPVEESVAS